MRQFQPLSHCETRPILFGREGETAQNYGDAGRRRVVQRGIIMTRKESGCVRCGLPCIGDACPNYRVTRLICDICGEEPEELYYLDGRELCADCVLNRLEKVSTDD